MNLPDTEQYTTWQAWAKKLVQVLGLKNQAQPLQLPGYALAKLPKAATDAQVIWVRDATGGPVPVYSAGGLWLRFDNNLQVF